MAFRPSRLLVRVAGVWLCIATAVAGGGVKPSEGQWWSLEPLQKPPVPAPGKRAPVHPIDAFIQAQLRAHGLKPSPEADRRTLIRRLTVDLHGLLPTPDEVKEFEQDKGRDAYERLVERLLASPRYGERWARHWLDVVHFAETHGHDQDRPRETAWPYRDYVIASLNSDKPYARFVAEQIAADALFPQQPELIPALGLLAAGPWDESSLRDIREDTLDRQIGRYLDRDDMVTTVMSAFASSTVHCARCHDHKFDPISQEDYYALQAVFAGTERAERLYDLDPRLNARRQTLMRGKLALDRQDKTAIARMLTPELRAELDAWEASLTKRATAWRAPSLESFVAQNGTELKALPDGSLLAGGASPADEIYTVTVKTDLTNLTAVQLEVLTDDSLPKKGPGRAVNGNLHLTEFRALAATGASGDFQPVALQSPSADFNQDGWDIAKAIDANPQTAWGVHPQEGKAHVAVFEFANDVGSASGGVMLRFVLEQQHGRQHTIGRIRLSVTDSPRPVRAVPVPAELAQALGTPRAQRSADDELKLAVHFLNERVTHELNALPPPQRVFAGANVFQPNGSQVATGVPREVHVLTRGEITRPAKAAAPGALACVGTLAARFPIVDGGDEAARRAALARWLSDADNPLTWRSAVNRAWHYHFGRGLVDTPSDFGRMGSRPSHPELLDWLAVEFRDHGGSLKWLHRLIVTSAAYRQVSMHRAEAARVDSDNRLLWRMNRLRLDAETVRDSVLQLSGKLDLTMGGPSVKQFAMSPGIHVTPKVDYAAFDVDSPANHRRAIYRFLFRTLPDPFMDALDSPAGDQLTPVRSESVTALQAFALLNNPFIVRQSEHFAARLEALSPQREPQVRAAFQFVFNRAPTTAELRAFTAHAEKHGLANVCRLLLNSNEFLFLN
ncbi:MAG: DUF1549 and DUF1553 domain-containing protein [Verrucomicrobiota bacterium]